MPMTMLDEQKHKARSWFESLQGDIIARFEALETEAQLPLYHGVPGQFEKTDWTRGDGSAKPRWSCRLSTRAPRR